MASKSLVRVKLSEQWQRGKFKCYAKCIGGRKFYFTQDREIAERVALSLTTVWQRLQAAGLPWDDKLISSAYTFGGTPPYPSKTHERKLPAVHLHAAMDEYLKDYRQRVGSHNASRTASTLRLIRKHQADMPLTTVTADTLNGMVSHFRSRPLTQRQKPMAVDTVQETLKTLRRFFDWCDMTGRWEAPRRFERLFRVKYQSLKTLSERRSGANGQKVFTLTELQQLWQAATDQQRLHLGLALNTGETAQGIADLTKTDLRMGSQWSVDRHRAKTGVRGVYALWPPVQELLVRFINTDASEQRLLTTLEGNPLVWVTENWRCDSVAKLWAKLMKRVPHVSRLSFKYLRKTGASMIYEITGSIDVVELYLSHAGRGVAQKHYLTRNTDWLAKPLQELGERLASAMPMVATKAIEKTHLTTDCR